LYIQGIQVGMLGTNCYLVACPETKEAIVIDPGDEGKRIFNLVTKNGFKVTGIVNTHGHWDHVGGNKELKKLTGAPILIHEQDADFLTDGRLHLGSMMGKNENSPQGDRILKEGDIVQVGKYEFKVVHTPGHTPGGISLVGKDVVFVGDTLFAGSIGRTDLPGGNYDTLMTSIKNKLLPLSDDIIVYPGHGPSTTIGKERKSNPFLLNL
jgi:hydroxyacylglutathione hydrolase